MRSMLDKKKFGGPERKKTLANTENVPDSPSMSLKLNRNH